MLTQAIPQLQRTGLGALPLPALAAVAQSLGNCAQPLQHRGPLALEQPFQTRRGGVLPRGGWDPGQFGYNVNQGGFVDAPRIYLGRQGDTSNYYGGNEFNFNTNNEFSTIFNQGGPTFNVGGNSFFSNQYTNNLYSSNFYTTYVNGNYGPSSPSLHGPAGRDGLSGRDGVTGAVGPRGTDGLPGLSGLPGPSGAPGSPGRSGSPGAAGVAGAAGENGLDGRDAASGRDGMAGPAGGDGQDGADGQDGTRGASGNDGRNGFGGRDGRNGMPGMDGAPGAPGMNGMHGITKIITFTLPGRPGPPGNAGRPGLQRPVPTKVLRSVKFNTETCKLEPDYVILNVLGVRNDKPQREVADA